MKPVRFLHLFIPFLWLAISGFPMGIRGDVGEKSYRDAGANQGDYKAGEKVPDFSSTCVFVSKSKKGENQAFGSGVLISSNLVLTATHVILNERNPAKIDLSAKIHFGTDIENPTSVHEMTKVQLPPLWKSNRLRRVLVGMAGFAKMEDEDRASFHDIALVTIHPPATNVHAIVSDKLPTSGDTVWFSGYGEVGEGDKKRKRRQRAPTTRLAAQNILDRVLVEEKEDVEENSPTGGSLLCDFDNGKEDYNRLNLEKAKRHLAICKAGKSDPKPLPLEATCHQGDSGGPMFARIGEQWVLVGICSYVFEVGGPKQRAAFQFGEIFSYTSVPGFRDWMEEVSGQNLPLR